MSAADDPTTSNELFVTDDGSHSLRSSRFEVPYHSRHGAVQESRHVFIQAGLKARVAKGDLAEVNILEMGLGTGLNALLARQYAAEHPELNFGYYAFERYPIALAAAGELNYSTTLGVASDYFLQLHTTPAGQVNTLDENFSFAKSETDFLRGLPEYFPQGQFDVVFYDAFAPNSQPELWSVAALQQCYDALREGGVFVTYCAKGQFKRDLRNVGFTVEALPGPPGKREMTRAYRR